MCIKNILLFVPFRSSQTVSDHNGLKYEPFSSIILIGEIWGGDSPICPNVLIFIHDLRKNGQIIGLATLPLVVGFPCLGNPGPATDSQSLFYQGKFFNLCAMKYCHSHYEARKYLQKNFFQNTSHYENRVKTKGKPKVAKNYFTFSGYILCDLCCSFLWFCFFFVFNFRLRFQHDLCYVTCL